MNWFALYVQSRHEKVTALALGAKGFETCLPLSSTLRRRCDRRTVVEEPVFPGYVFCRFDPAVRAPILRTAGIVRIIGFGKELVPLHADEVNAMQILERAKLPVEPWPFLGKGHLVCIEDGPLKGLTGIVIECKKGFRVVISVSLLQRSVAVEVSQWLIRPLNSRPLDMATPALLTQQAAS